MVHISVEASIFNPAFRLGEININIQHFKYNRVQAQRTNYYWCLQNKIGSKKMIIFDKPVGKFKETSFFLSKE